MKENAKKIYMIILIIAGMILSWLFLDYATSYKPEHTTNVEFHEEYVYGIDLWQQNYMVYRVNMESGESSRIKVSRMKNGNTCILSDLSVTADGKAYVLQSLNNGKSVEKKVYSCDFEKEKLEFEFNIELNEDTIAVAVQRFEDNLQILDLSADMETRQYLPEGNKLVLNKVFPRLDDSIIVYSIDEDGGFVGISRAGELYVLDKNEKYRKVFDGIRSEEEGWLTELSSDRDGIYFVNSKDKKSYTINPSLANPRPELCDRPVWHAETFDEERLSSISSGSGDGKSGILSTEDGRQLAAVCGTHEYIVEELEWSLKKRIFIWGIFWILFMIAGLIVKEMIRRQKVIPLALEAAALTAILLIPGIKLCEERIMLAIQENAFENDTEAAIQMGYDYIDQENLHELEYADLLRGYIQYGLYEEREDELYAVSSLTYTTNAPLKNGYIAVPQLLTDAMEKAIDEKSVQVVKYMDLVDQRCSVFIPVPEDKSPNPMVLEVQFSLESNDRTFISMAMPFHRLIYLIAGLLFAVLIVSIWYFMRPVMKLKQAALSVIKGGLGVKADVKGRSEAAIVANEFNHMSEQLKLQVSGLQQYREKYEAFVPLLLWKRVLDNSRIRENERPAMLITMSVGNEDRRADLKFITEEIRRGGGEILSFERDAITCLFLENKEKALTSAITILEKDKGKRGIAIGFEKIFLGVIGNSSRSAIEAYSTNGNYNGYLRRLAEELNTPLIMTQSAMEEIEGFFDKFKVRYLGKCLNKTTGRAEKLYEVLDGAAGEDRRLKEIQRDKFEEGISAFEQGDDMRAYTIFLSLYSENKNDFAARCYVRICNDNLMEKTKDREIYIGQY